MSLQQAANYLASKGRNGDSTLIHMAPGEVRSLQALAMAHGGSLTINPHTGLPEASFLKKLLPTLIGLGITAATGGAAAPWMVGLGVGGVEALRTGSLSKGIMAGLGAYGGAGLGAGLAGAGASGMNAAATRSILQANPGVAASEIGREMGTAGFVQPSIAAAANPATAGFADKLAAGAQGLGSQAGRAAFIQQVGGPQQALRYGMAAAGPILAGDPVKPPEDSKDGPLPRLTFEPRPVTPFPVADVPGYGDLGRDFGREQRYFDSRYVPAMAMGGPVEQMSQANAMGSATDYPMANVAQGAYSSPLQQPYSSAVVSGPQDAGVSIFTGEQVMAGGGLSHLGDYSDGGRLLKGPGDGVSDSIPAMIGQKQPARLADGEFVVPARIVSELGNGSTDAGARKLYAMMDRVQKSRGKTVGKGRVAVNSRAEQYLPA